MSKKSMVFLWLVILFLMMPSVTMAYSLGMDVNQSGYVSYSYPVVLGDDDRDGETEERKIEKSEEKRIEVKETPRVEKPEKIEIKREEKKIKVEFKNKEKVEQEMKPESVNLKFSAAPKASSVKENEVERNSDEENRLQEVIREREKRVSEKMEIQSEVHDDGTVEMQVESRNIKAKIKNSEIELDVKSNNIGSTDSQGRRMELVHLPDQAMERFLSVGVTATDDTLEVGQSGDNYEYTVDATKTKKLFGLIPRETKYKLSLNDSTGTVEQRAVANNVIEQILNLFSY